MGRGESNNQSGPWRYFAAPNDAAREERGSTAPNKEPHEATDEPSLDRGAAETTGKD